MKIAAIIVAAGRGLRAGGPEPKQWQRLGGARVIDHAIAAFGPVAAQIVAVLHPDDLDRLPQRPGLQVVPGGATRGASVRAGLQALSADAPDLVLIHDGARPLVSPAVIDRVIAALAQAPGAAPALPVTDALWTGATEVNGTVSREGLWRAQTPQGFHFGALLAAYAADDGSSADDVAVARAAGLRVAIVAGDEANIKITHPGDLIRAERLGKETMDMRIGNGFDVHCFGPGDHVWLCGVQVPHSHGLVGHSDADVALHALTDAIYGAMAQGDIGQHFPPSDPQWRGAASSLFLAHARDLAASMGYRLGNADLTIVAEAPRIGPHSTAMRTRMAALLGVDADRIGLKATTAEEMGFVGRREGIVAMATVLMVPA